MSESIHDKLKRVRKPRVHITYDVETNGAVEKRELPFVAGVMGDYSGDNTENKKALRDRKFVQIDRDNFNEAMSKINPKLNMKVENTLKGDGSELGVELDFKNMSDFDPEKIVDQVAPLKQLLETRNKLRDLMTKVDRSEELEGVLEKVLQSSDALKDLSSQLGIEDKKGDE
jgi:type VI secretion system protein ImpB